MNCPKCGSKLGSNVKFCKHCGENVESITRSKVQPIYASTQSTQPMHAPNQSTRPMYAPTQPFSMPEYELKRKKRIRRRIIGILIVIFGYGIMMPFIFFNRVQYIPAQIYTTLLIAETIITCCVGIPLIISGRDPDKTRGKGGGGSCDCGGCDCDCSC